MEELKFNHIIVKLVRDLNKNVGLPAKLDFLKNESEYHIQTLKKILKNLDPQEVNIKLLEDIGKNLGYPLTKKRSQDIESYRIKIIKQVLFKTEILRQAVDKIKQLIHRLDKINEFGAMYGFPPLSYDSSEAKIQAHGRKIQAKVKDTQTKLNQLEDKLIKEEQEKRTKNKLKPLTKNRKKA